MKSLVSLFLFLPFCVQAQQKITVTGTITGLPDSWVSLVDINKPSDTIAKAKSVKGNFVLKGTLQDPSLLVLNMEGNKKLTVFLDKGKITMKGAYANPAQIKVTGSATQTAFRSFQDIFVPNFEKLSQYNMRGQSGDHSDSLQMAAQNLIDRIQTDIDQFVDKNPSSPVSSFILVATIGLKEDMALLESRVAKLKPEAMVGTFGKYLEDMVGNAKATAIGSIATDFTQNDTLDAPVKLSSFRGKYVLLDFWASWCGPCRQENPNVVRTFQKFKDKNFTVLGVSLDRQGQKNKWLDAIHRDNLTWTHVSDLQFWQNSVAQLYKVQSIPQNFLIDPTGKIIAKNLRGPDLEAKLCEVLGCN